MNTKQIITIAAFAAASLTSCSTSDTATRHNVATAGQEMAAAAVQAIATAPSPTSVTGKKISLDYSSAESCIGDSSEYPNIKWGAWQKCEPSITTTLKFGKNNKAERRLFADDYTIWTYKKTGASTAELTIEEHEYGETFYLTFDSETTGTAKGGTQDDCNGYSKVVNIRFTIK